METPSIDRVLARCILALRTRGWSEAARDFATIVAAIPPGLPESRGPALAALLAAREREDALAAADLLASDLAELFATAPEPASGVGAARTGSDGISRRSVTTLDPAREAAQQRRNLPEARSGLLLAGCAGTPLLESLLDEGRSAPPLLLWEPDATGVELCRRALARTERFARVLPAAQIPEPEDLRQRLSSAAAEVQRFEGWIHPWLAGDDRDRAWRVCAIARSLGAVEGSALARPRIARTRPLRIVLLDRGRPFFGEEDLGASLEGAGHQMTVRSVHGSERDEATADALLRDPPDLVLSVNGVALSLSPLVREVLAVAAVPTVLWFVDDPETCLRPLERYAGEHVLALAWEREAVGRLRAHGFRGASYLPHATRHSEAKIAAPWPDAGDLVWAASSYAGADRQGIAHAAGGRPETEALVEAFMEKLASDPRLAPAAVRKALLRMPAAAALLPTAEDALFVQIRAADRLAVRNRSALARALLPEGLRLYGDVEGWRRCLGPDAPVAPALHPTRELPRLYFGGDQRARICVDQVHPQMPTAVSQRAFDVPACGGVLLADDRPDLREHLEIGIEALAFGDTAEAVEMVRWCRSQPAAAARLGRAGQRRVRRQHRWSRRIRQLLDLAQAHFGRSVLGA